jgi:hypothetical protein
LSDEQRRTLLARMQALPHVPPAAPASSIPVTNCDDSGPGSYRDAVTNAVSGDTIDLTSTPCSVITLTTGDVITAANDLTLQGPGALSLTISGGYNYRPLDHIGTGRQQRFHHFEQHDRLQHDAELRAARRGIADRECRQLRSREHTDRRQHDRSGQRTDT